MPFKVEGEARVAFTNTPGQAPSPPDNGEIKVQQADGALVTRKADGTTRVTDIRSTVEQLASGPLATAFGLKADLVNGLVPIAQLPPVGSAVVASGDLTTLTTQQQAQIVEGVTVITSPNGTRYVYKGSGSKTLAASYTIVGSGVVDYSQIQNPPALKQGAFRDVGTTAGTLVDGADARLLANANAFQRGDNTFPGPNFATYTTAYAGITAGVNPLPLSCRAGGNTVGVTDVILATVDLPYSNANPSGIHACAVAGIARTADPNMGALGIFGAAMANAAPGRVSQVFGANFVVTNKPTLIPNEPNKGLENVELYGIEIDVACERTASGGIPNNVNIRGTWTTGNCEVMTNGLLCAHYVGYAGAFNQIPFKEGFRTQDGGAVAAFMAGLQPGNGAVGSAPLVMRSRDSSGNVREGKISTDAGGNVIVAPGGGALVSLAPNGTTSVTTLSAATGNFSSNVGVGGNLTVNGAAAATSLSTQTINAASSITSPGVSCTNLVASNNINFMGQNVQLCAPGPIPAGFKGLMIAG